MAWPWNLGHGSLKFLSAFDKNYGAISYRLQDIHVLISRKSRNFYTLLVVPAGRWPRRHLAKMFDTHKTGMIWLPCCEESRHVEPFRYTPGPWQTDRENNNFYITIVLTRHNKIEVSNNVLLDIRQSTSSTIRICSMGDCAQPLTDL